MFGSLSESVIPYFSELKSDMKKSKLRTSIQEYFSNAMLISMLIFIFEMPLLSFIFSLYFQNFLFGFISAFTVTTLLTLMFFFAFINYPKMMIKERSKKIDGVIPFASIYLSSIVGSKLPLNKVFEIFSKFGEYGDIRDDILSITKDTELFGMDINTALERAADRTPSKSMQELLWGILTINKTGGDLDTYIKEKTKTFVAEYRRKIYEYSNQVSLIIEVYLTSIVIGAIFFTILTSIMSGISTSGVSNLVVIQFLLITFFLPSISVIFILLIKSMQPGGE
jgi:flagellar protein FlaJ